jgi:hypothetical protein
MSLVTAMFSDMGGSCMHVQCSQLHLYNDCIDSTSGMQAV